MGEHDDPVVSGEVDKSFERATLSGIVATLVRKGLIDQTAGSEDQRQRVLRLSHAGGRSTASW
jgi:DNA-binding MarR family transcriptional regulator